MATAQAWKVLNTDPEGDGGFLRKDFPFLSMAMTETQLHLTTPTQELLEMPVVTGSAAAMGCDQ